MMTQPEQQKRQVTIFRVADAVDQALTGMRDGPTVMSPETQQSLMKTREAGRDAGLTSHLLTRQQDGFSVLLLWAKPNYPLPRHSHDSDCMYYVVSGSLIMGDQTLRAGDGFFVPADALYVYSAGPDGAEVLETRYGVNKYKTVIPDVSDRRWQTELDVVKANAERWKQMEVSPTFAANRSGG
jgi:mannose-6-phosphate isomerase-like protein (cupin superfamily)